MNNFFLQLFYIFSGISGLSNYFANSLESAIWLSPKLGVCHVTRNLLGHSLNPLSLAQIDQVRAIRVTRKDDCYYNVELDFKVNLSSKCTSLSGFDLYV